MPFERSLTVILAGAVNMTEISAFSKKEIIYVYVIFIALFSKNKHFLFSFVRRHILFIKKYGFYSFI